MKTKASPRVLLLSQQIAASDEKAEQLHSQIDELLAEGKEAPAELVKQIKELNKESEDWAQELNEISGYNDLKTQRDQRKSALASVIAQASSEGGASVPVPAGRVGADDPTVRDQHKTIGQMYVDRKEFTEYVESISINGEIPRGKRVDTPPMEVKTLLRGALDSAGGALVGTDRLSTVVPYSVRELTIFDLITRGETDSDTIEFVRTTGFTNNAAPTAEATVSTENNSSGKKPESAMTFAVVNPTVKTIAHWIPATRRILQDAKQLRTLIDSFLEYGLQQKLEDQVLSGDGSGENFDGVLHKSGTTPQAYATDLLVTTRKARTTLKLAHGVPTAYMFSPADWEAIDLLKDGENRFYWGGPTVMGTPRLWGIPVIESEAMTTGTAVLADWKQCVLWDRMQSSIFASDSHSDFFTRNLIAILAELRAAFDIYDPSKIVIVDLTP